MVSDDPSVGQQLAHVARDLNGIAQDIDERQQEREETLRKELRADGGEPAHVTPSRFSFSVSNVFMLLGILLLLAAGADLASDTLAVIGGIIQGIAGLACLGIGMRFRGGA